MHEKPLNTHPPRLTYPRSGGCQPADTVRMGTLMVDGYRIEPLSMRTWDAFADLAERHNGE